MKGEASWPKGLVTEEALPCLPWKRKCMGKKNPAEAGVFLADLPPQAALQGICDLMNWCPEEDSNLHTVAGART